MKYQNGKIKSEHGRLKEFNKFLSRLEKIEEVERIIPGRIGRTQGPSSNFGVSFSYFTQSGMKLNMKKGGTRQELFVTCKEENKESLKLKVELLIGTFVKK